MGRPCGQTALCVKHHIRREKTDAYHEPLTGGIASANPSAARGWDPTTGPSVASFTASASSSRFSGSTLIRDDPNAAAIVRAILAMGQSVGLEVIAEGIETEAQRDLLRSWGCALFQRYLFGKPAPIDALGGLVIDDCG